MNGHLYRSVDDRMLAGVAGGLAELWDADPSLIRVGWVLLAILTGGIALVVYIVMAIVVPEEPLGMWAPGASPAAAAPAPVIPGWVAPGAGPVATDPATVATGAAPVATDPATVAPATATPWFARESRREARRAERAARRAARGDRRDGSAGIVIGGLLVVIGAAFFVRELIPSFDVDLVWPLLLIGLGVVLLVGSVTRRPDASRERSS